MRKIALLIVLAALAVGAGLYVRHGLTGPTAPNAQPPTPAQPAPAQPKPDSKPAVGLRVGSQAPDFTLRSAGGATIRLGDLRGKPVLINFWATWCPPCRAEMPEIQRYWSGHSSEIQILAVDLTTSEKSVADVTQFMAERKYTYPVGLDEKGTVSNLYGVISLPTSYFLDADGIIRAVRVGPMDYATIGVNFAQAQ